MSCTGATAWLSGFIPDVPTPFDEAGRVDFSALALLCERQIEAGVSALIVAETTGEFTTLTAIERDAIIRTAATTARGRVRVVAGAGSNSTSEAAERARYAEAAGADALLSVVPYYNKPMQAGIEAHFRAIANSTALPVILHDSPQRTVREIADDTLLKLAELPRLIGLLDAAGNLHRPIRLRPMLPTHFRFLTGDDAAALAYLAAGGDGCVSVMSNIAPATCQDIFSNYQQGRMQPAQQLQQLLLPLSTSLAKENPASVKYALSRLGLMHPDTRLPLVGLSNKAKAEVAAELVALDETNLTLDETNASRAISARGHAYSAAPGDTP